MTGDALENAAAPAAHPEAEPASLVTNSVLLLASRVLGVAASGVVSVAVVRTLPVSSYAHLALAMAIIGVVGSLSELGVSALVVRELATKPAEGARIVGVGIATEILTSLLGAALIVPIGLALGYPSVVIVLLAIGCGVLLAQGTFACLSGAFQARRVFAAFALANVLQSAITLVGSLAVLALGGGPRGLVAVLGAAYLSAAVMSYVLVRTRLGIRPQFAGALGQVAGFVRAAVPITATAATAVIYGRVDVLLLSKLDGTRAVAVYNIPRVLVELMFLLPAAVSTAFFPLLTRQLEDDPADAHRSFGLLWRIFLLGSVPISIVLSAGGTDFITLLFGARYRESGTVLAIMAWTVAANFINYLLWYALLAARRERGRAPVMIAGLAVNIALNVVLIPVFGAKGAAAGLLLSDLFMIVWLTAIVNRTAISLPYLRLAVWPLVAGGAAGGLLAALSSSGVPGIARGAAAAALYLAVLLSCRYVAPAEWAPLKVPLRARFNRG